MSDEGRVCPTVRHAPRTGPGRRVVELALSPAMTRRAGVDGAITGLDVPAIAARLAGVDPDLVHLLAEAAERGLLDGVADQQGRNAP